MRACVWVNVFLCGLTLGMQSPAISAEPKSTAAAAKADGA